jgi:hypothetical protein
VLEFVVLVSPVVLPVLLDPLHPVALKTERTSAAIPRNTAASFLIRALS